MDPLFNPDVTESKIRRLISMKPEPEFFGWSTFIRANFLSLFFLVSISVFSQQEFQKVEGRVVDSESGEPLAFVAISIGNSGQGTYSDIDGYFHIDRAEPGMKIGFHYLGYTSSSILWNGQEVLAIELVKTPVSLAMVEIRPGENPAERIIRKAIENKKENDPEGDLNFTYDSYNKLVFTGVLDSSQTGGSNIGITIVSDSTSADSARVDSAAVNPDQDAIDFFNSQHLFLMESISQRKFMAPDRSEETIIATRVSGLKNPDFALLGTQLQSFSFYEETVEILDHNYLSPLSDIAINKYHFILEDTTFMGVDTVFTISFQPRKGKNFEGLKGQLFINTNGFAIQQVLAGPAEVDEDGFNIRIQQKYEFVDGLQWFPVQLNSQIDMPFIEANSFALVGIGRSYIRDIKLDVPMRAREFTPVTLQMDRLAAKQPDSLWNKYREHALDEKELKTYHVIDSIGKAENLDKKLAIFQMVTTGKIPIGVVSLDLDRFLRFNRYEGFRLGVGLHTNDFFSKRFTIGGYYAYGFRDKGSKYGGDIQVHLHRKRNAWVKLLYENDVMETGGNQFDKPLTALDPAKYYQLYVNRMDRREKYEFQVNGRLIGNLTATIFGNHQVISPFEDYYFETSSDQGVTLYDDIFETTEAGFKLRYAPGERLARTGTREIRLGGRWPVLWFQYTAGLKDVIAGEYDYNRLDFMVEKKFRFRAAGELDIRVVAGTIDNNLPISLLYNSRGTFGHFGLATPFAFETMSTNEFQHSEYGILHIRQNFRDLLFRGKKEGPYVNLVHSMMWGKLGNEDLHNTEMKAADNGYYESGIEVDRILKMQFSGFGLGVFYRYGPYHLSDEIDNFAFKMSYTLSF